MKLSPIGFVVLAAAAMLAVPRSNAQDDPNSRSANTRETIRRVAYHKVEGEHPLMPTLRLAQSAVKRLEKVKDYAGTLVRRERIGGQLKGHEQQYLKVRHEPFSVYSYFQGSKRGSEVIYVDGKNDGRMWAHEVGSKARLVGTVSMNPEGPRARKEARRPITQAGLLNLARRAVIMAEHDSQYGECEVKLAPDAKINGRGCLCIEVTHPVPRREFNFHVLRFFFDYEWAIPVRFVGYTWPKQKGGEPVLLEEYTFLNLKFDNGFTDTDFDIRNPKYRFPPVR